jgi:equilibrative nucleoside transporter 1/2/3
MWLNTILCLSTIVVLHFIPFAFQGLAGIFASVASVLSIAGDSKPEDSALGYFLSAVAITALCLISFFVLLRLSYARYYMTVHKYHTSSSSLSQQQQRTPKFFAIFQKIWMVAVDVFLTFFVTLAIYPGVSANVKSVDAPSVTTPTTATDDNWTGKYFTPLTCFLLFNCGDFVGRTIASWIPLISHQVLWIPVVLRFAFLPLFALCNVHPRMSSAPVVFDSDIYPIVFMALMALSNGYFSTLAMMYAPRYMLFNFCHILFECDLGV